MKALIWIILAVLLAPAGCAQNHKISQQSSQPDTQDDSGKGFVLLELFTSQGCSSCPPADRNLTALIEKARLQHKNVYALAFHVDYWNRLGWKDPFSTAQATDRQAMYVRAMQLQSAYTPQMIVNGETEFVGSDVKNAEKAVQHYLNQPSVHNLALAVPGTIDGNIESVSYHIEGDLSNTQICAAITESNKLTDIKRGENKGSTLHNDHVVMWFECFEPKSSGSIKLPKEFTAGKTNTDVVIFLQNTITKKVVAAGSVRL